MDARSEGDGNKEMTLRHYQPVVVKTKACLPNALHSKAFKILGIIAFCFVWLGVITLTVLGYVSEWAKLLATWGPTAHLLIFVFFFAVSTPLGYGYLIGLVTFGYAMGFAAAPAAIGGYYFGTAFTYYLTRYVAHDYASLRLEKLFERHRLKFGMILELINRNKFQKWFGLFSLRHVAILTLGWSNVFLCIVMLQLNEGMPQYI